MLFRSLTVGALHLVHGVGPQLPRVDRVGAEVGGDGVAQHIQFHRALEKNAAEPIVVVVQRALNGGKATYRIKEAFLCLKQELRN